MFFCKKTNWQSAYGRTHVCKKTYIKFVRLFVAKTIFLHRSYADFVFCIFAHPLRTVGHTDNKDNIIVACFPSSLCVCVCVCAEKMCSICHLHVNRINLAKSTEKNVITAKKGRKKSTKYDNSSSYICEPVRNI